MSVVQNASVVLTSLYSLRPATRPIAGAVRRVMGLAREAGVPVAFGLGTAGLVRSMRDEVREVLQRDVTIAAMNLQEATALTGEEEALLAAEKIGQGLDDAAHLATELATDRAQQPRVVAGVDLLGVRQLRLQEEVDAEARQRAAPHFQPRALGRRQGRTAQG